MIYCLYINHKKVLKLFWFRIKNMLSVTRLYFIHHFTPLLEKEKSDWGVRIVQMQNLCRLIPVLSRALQSLTQMMLQPQGSDPLQIVQCKCPGLGLESLMTAFPDCRSYSKWIRHTCQLHRGNVRDNYILMFILVCGSSKNLFSLLLSAWSRCMRFFRLHL